MKNVKSWIGMFLLSIFTMLGSIGFSSWFVKNEKTKQYIKEPDSTVQKVAYTQNGGKNTYFTTVEGALAHRTDNTIYVIPGTNPTIKYNCTIPSGVTLCIPYEDDLNKTHNYLNEKGNNGSGFADKDASNLVTRLTLNNVTLTIQGTLVIGGVNGSVGVQSVVSGKYSEVLCKDSTIKTKREGKIQCYGFIKEKRTNADSIMEFEDGASIESFLGIYDYSTATALLNAKDNGVFPLKQFDAPHIRPKMLFHYGSEFYGKIHTYGTNAGDLNTMPMLIGKAGAFICMSSNDSFVSWKYSDSDEEITSDKFGTHKTEISLIGSCVAGSLKVSIKKLFITTEINSKDFYMPVPYSFSIRLLSGADFTVPETISGIKFMPGSELIVEKGASVSFNANTVFYKNCTATDGTTFSYPTKESAVFINNGIIEINSGFDGSILINDGDNDSAKVITGSNYGDPANSKEGESKSVYYWGGGRANLAIKTYDCDQTNGFYFKALGERGISGNKKYLSKSLLNSNDLAWYDDSDSDVSYGIEIISNLNDSTNPNNLLKLSFVKNGDDVELLPLQPNDSSAYSFEGYFYDSACAAQQLEYDNSRNIYRLNPKIAEQHIDSRGYVVVYGKWKHIENGTYTIETITKKQSSDKLGIENNASMVVSKPVGDLLELDNLSNHKICYYSSINASSNSGTLAVATFDGYDITIKNQDGLSVEEIKVDSSGNSIDGKIIQSFVLQDPALIQKDYTVSVKESLKIIETQYTLTMSTSSDSTISQGKSVDLSVNGGDVFTQNGIVLTCAWTSGDPKVSLNVSDLTASALNNYTDTTRWAWKTQTKTVSITAVIKDGTILLGTLTKTVKVESVSLKVI